MPALNQLGKAVSSEAVQQTKEYPSAILAEQVVKPGAGQDELKKKSYVHLYDRRSIKAYSLIFLNFLLPPVVMCVDLKQS